MLQATCRIRVSDTEKLPQMSLVHLMTQYDVAHVDREHGRTVRCVMEDSVPGEGFKVVCCACGVHVRGDPEAPQVSHGFCEGCGRAKLAVARKEAAEDAARRWPEKYLDRALEAREKEAGVRRTCEGCDALLPFGWSAVYCSTTCALADAR